MASLNPLGCLLAGIVIFGPTSSAHASASLLPGTAHESASEPHHPHVRAAAIRVSGLENPDVARFVESAALAVLDSSPRRFVDGLLRNGLLRIHIETLNDELSAADFCHPSDGASSKTFGRFDNRRKRIVLSRRLVELAWQGRMENGDDFDCLHRSYPQTLRATIVHELAHLYDDAFRASEYPQLAELTGGQKRWVPFRRNRIKNYNAAGSPDVYEFTNLAEAFAVNLEYYVLDENYRCASPAWSDFFDREFALTRNGSDADACEAYQSILLSSHVASDNLQRAVDLDPDHIYEIHYLHAAAGKGIASRWGHAMFRVVMCAPYQNVGRECLENPADDLVLSYRANVADVTLNYVRGLFGSYPSQLFVYELPEIIKEYTRGEFRDLISIPLELSDEEIRRFVSVTLGRYWTYQGKYYFFWNHCGTETVTHLGATLPADAVRGVSSLTPRRLLRSLPKSGLADRDNFERIVGSTSPGAYFFPSKEADYVAAFEALRQYVLYPFDTFEEFLERTSVEDRAFMYDGFLGTSEYAEAPADARAPVVATILHVERLLQTRAMKELSEEFVELLRGGDAALRDSVRNAFRLLFDEPWDLVDDGTYGVPRRSAVDTYLASRKPGDDLDLSIAALPRDRGEFGALWAKLEALRALEQRLSEELGALVRG